MHIFCKKCKQLRGNSFPNKLILISKKIIKGKSKHANCLTERTLIDKIKDKYDLLDEAEVCF